MNPMWTSCRIIVICSFGAILMVGCGGDDPPAVNETQNSTAELAELAVADQTLQSEPEIESQPQQAALPTAVIRQVASATTSDAEGSASSAALPEQGSPEWILRQIIIERLVPLPQSDDILIQRAKHARNKKIVDLATQVIALTHKDAEKQLVFDAAVRYLMESQMKLALDGDSDRIDELYEHAELLYRRDPKSNAASEAAFTLARFAHTNAQRFANQEPRWVEEFSRQARLFATKFPHEEPRAVSLLFSAAQSCELFNLSEESVRCYSTIRDSFPNNPRTKQVVGCLRRMELKGQKLQLAGPTINGGFVSIDDYRGKLVLIVFWGTQAKPFHQQLPLLMQVSETYQQAGLEVIGVNLDLDESVVDTFLKEHSIAWPQIFYTEREKRGWNNPIASYYGIRSLPAIWLVSRNGQVLSSAVRAKQLDGLLRAQF